MPLWPATCYTRHHEPHVGITTYWLTGIHSTLEICRALYQEYFDKNQNPADATPAHLHAISGGIADRRQRLGDFGRRCRPYHLLMDPADYAAGCWLVNRPAADRRTNGAPSRRREDPRRPPHLFEHPCRNP